MGERKIIIQVIFLFFLMQSLFLLREYIPAEAEDTVISTHTQKSWSFLPDEIVKSYFPGHAEYLIPENDTVTSLITRAEKYAQEGNYRQAYRLYTGAYRRACHSPAAPYIGFARIYMMNSVDGSIKALQTLIDTYPSFPLIDAVMFELEWRFYF